MAIGLTAKQRADLAAMLPNIEESAASLKRLIADAKDRTRALQKLDDAEAAQKRHASDVGIPFNSEAFARRRAELNALPKVLTVEEGQLASFSALQRAIGVILEGPYRREAKGASKSAGAKRPTNRSAVGKAAGKKAPRSAKKSSAKAGPRLVDRKATGRKAQGTRTAPSTRTGAASTPAHPRAASRSAPTVPADRSELPPRAPAQKPLPLSLGS